ncbi:ribosome maturation protein RimP [Stakelama saccharophila]|uniref:Ribosome maturation factor RimP n=1 Tax=Stakelama saccharophila TaxID=3075605 RepID=A0ABZ0B9F2_9SPHN|nr:ribosome maturation protein RimP [Stakelama sp. W311]WNO53913.1 ribosome maturation protein RimP [Stakelama sp. W311]
MADLAELTALIEPEAKALGLDLVRVAMFGGKSDPTLQVMAERPDTRQLTIDDCAALSHRVSDKFDALEAEGRDPIDHAYRLEVSSPGIDRPLTRLADYRDWTGHEARITLRQVVEKRKRIQGPITSVEDDRITIDVKNHGPMAVPFDAIEDAKLVMTDALIAATQPLSAEGADEIVEMEG